MRHGFCKRVLRWDVLIVVCLFSLLRASGQTNLPDNMVNSDCTTDAMQQPWDAQVLHYVSDIHSYFVPLVGDIDGDGIVEIVAAKAVSNDRFTSQLGISAARIFSR